MDSGFHFSKLGRSTRGFFQDKSGNIIILSALIFIPVMGIAAFAIDLPNGYHTKSVLQTAAEAGALAGAVLLPTDVNGAKTKALTVAMANLPSGYQQATTGNDITLGTYDAQLKSFVASNTNINAIKVVSIRSVARGNPLKTFFASFLSINNMNISATAIATLVSTPCVIALSSSASPALSVSGGAGMDVSKCSVTVNSTSSTAAVASAPLKALKICGAGGFSGQFSPSPQKCSPAKDPLSSLPEPSPGTCQSVPALSGNVTLYPGTYCSSLDISSANAINFAPGIFYFKGSNVSIGGNVSVSSSGTMLFLDQSSQLNISTTGSVNIAPPTSGVYKGISVFQSRSTPLSINTSIVGGGVYNLKGTIYAPSSSIKVASISSSANDAYFGDFISSTFAMYGDSNFHVLSDSSTTANALSPVPALVY